MSHLKFFEDALYSALHPLPEHVKNGYFGQQIEQIIQEENNLAFSSKQLCDTIRDLNHRLHLAQTQAEPIFRKEKELRERKERIRKFVTKHADLVVKMEEAGLTSQQKEYLLEWYQVDGTIMVGKGYYQGTEQMQRCYGAFRVLAKISHADLLALRPLINLEHQFPARRYIDCETDGDAHFLLKDKLENKVQRAILFPEEKVDLGCREKLKRSY